MKFSLYPPIRNESCKVACHDGIRTYLYEMRGSPEFTEEELSDIHPKVRSLFREWLEGAQDRYRRSGVVKGGIYGAQNKSGSHSPRDRKRQEDPGESDNSESGHK